MSIKLFFFWPAGSFNTEGNILSHISTKHVKYNALEICTETLDLFCISSTDHTLYIYIEVGVVTGASGLSPFTFLADRKQQTRLISVLRSCSVYLPTHCNPYCTFAARLTTYPSPFSLLRLHSLSPFCRSLSCSLNHRLTTQTFLFHVLSSQYVFVYYNKETSFVWEKKNAAGSKTKDCRGVQEITDDKTTVVTDKD